MKWGIERSRLVTRMAEVPGWGPFINRQYDRYLRLKFRTNWRLMRNPASRRAFARSRVSLTAKQQWILNELNENGVAVGRVDELFQSSELWSQLSGQMKAFTQSEKMRSYLQEQQKAFSDSKDPNAVAHYIFTYYDQNQKPLIQTSSPLLDFATSSIILDVVNSYFGMWSKLIYFDM